MEDFDILIIGSGVAGYHALKELGNAKVAMVTSDKYLPYDRPPLSKEYMRGEKKREELFFEGEEAYKNVNVKLNTEVKMLRQGEAELSTGEVLGFKKAIIATGGTPRRLSLSGGELRGVHYLRSLEDADSIKEDAGKSKNVVIIGGGFIGMEVAASLTSLGLSTTVIEVKPYIWNTFVDERTSKFIQSYFEKKGVKFILNESVKEISGKDKVERVTTEGGKGIDADMVLIAVGIRPNIELAQRSGISTENGIIVNEFLETSMRNVYAAGDVANIPYMGKRLRIEHWNNAEYTGRLAGKNASGNTEKYDFLSSVWSDIFDMHIESAGETYGYDQEIVRGKMENNSFNLIYVKGGVIVGYLSVNRDFEELNTLNELIKRTVEVKGKEGKIEDEQFNLSSLLS
ncbi:hypothetical protein HS7_13200 [Sulfolobales archaeon HS-7]|nr:hypothetical protein HS7_13200 [Sulfolobales archaeon HS-7]